MDHHTALRASTDTKPLYLSRTPKGRLQCPRVNIWPENVCDNMFVLQKRRKSDICLPHKKRNRSALTTETLHKQKCKEFDNKYKTTAVWWICKFFISKDQRQIAKLPKSFLVAGTKMKQCTFRYFFMRKKSISDSTYHINTKIGQEDADNPVFEITVPSRN